ncbi:hypothetical protein DZK25_00565, partial [Wenzhouxiangella sp. 15181]
MAGRASLVDVDRIKENLVSLIRIPSVTGEEDAAVSHIANWLQQFDAEIDYWNDGIASLQRDPRYPGHEVESAWAPVVVGVLRGEQPVRSAHASKRLMGESALDHFLTIYKAIREDERRINEK